MRHVSLVAVLCFLCLGFAGCGSTASDDTAQADAAAAEQLNASASQHRQEQNKIESQANEADEQAAVATESEPEQQREPESAGNDAQAGSDSPAGAILSGADRTSFNELGSGLAGTEGLAIVSAGTGGRMYTAGALKTGVAWSTAKTAVAMAAIDAGVGQQSDLTSAITASDNAAAERLWTALGTDAAQRSTAQVRSAGDQQTTIQSERLRGASYTAFGQTQWSLADQARFAAGMTCVEAGRRVLNLMRNVVGGQRWGLGAIGSDPAFKGGWGPGVTVGASDGWLDRQLGIVSIDGKLFGVAIATTAPDHGSGTANLTKIAEWLASHADASEGSATPNC